MSRKFRPGDVILRDKGSKECERLVVQDPCRTKQGKLRVKNEGEDRIQTVTWGDTTTDLPKGSRVVAAAVVNLPRSARRS